MKTKLFFKSLAVWILTILYLLTFYWIGLFLYYLSKVFKIIGHTLLFEFNSAREELREFHKHYTNIGDL